MRLRRTFLILLCLLLTVGAWLLWQYKIQPLDGGKSAGQIARKKIVHPVSVPTKSFSSSSIVLPAALVTNSAQAAIAAKTNRFAYRLTNTTKTIGELTDNPRAILLENALIDTDESLDLAIPQNLKAQGDSGAYIVQANGNIDDSFRAMLAAAGAQIESYIPNNAYLVKVSTAGAAIIAGSQSMPTVIPYQPYYKLSPPLLAALMKEQPVGDLKLATFPGTEAGAKPALQKLGTIVMEEPSALGEIFTMRNVTDVPALAQNKDVRRVEFSYKRAPANDLARVTMGISTNTITTNNWMNLSGKNVIVEVNDSGIDATHPDLALNGSAGSPGTGPSRVVGDSIQSLTDTDGHGTHVAGIIAGNGSESFTIPKTPRGSVTNADFRGKAPAATLYSIGFLGDDTNNIISDRYLQERAANTNALISNNSWVLVGDNTYDLSAASFDASVRDALPTTIGSQPVLFVFAAGNSGGGNDNGGSGDPDTISSPSTAKNVITVGALEQLRNLTNIVTDASSNSSAVWQPMTDSANQVASYSSRGNVGVGTEGAFGRFKPDVIAPGSFVVSTRSGQWDTNAYYNPTNYSYLVATDQIIDTNSPKYYSVSVPANAVEVDVFVTTNSASPSPFPNFPIYVSLNDFPDPNNPATYDFIRTNQVHIPPDSGGTITGIQSIQNGGFNFAINDGTNITASYDVTVQIVTTNDLGNYLQVLQGLNETLAPYYRYETGTSMAAPAISGLLALMQDYFTNRLAMTPSPALLKAMLINGARAVNNYRFAVTNSINFQGWGLANLTNSLPVGLTNTATAQCASFFVDQSPTNVLATGDSHTFLVTINTNNTAAASLPLRVTLAWTDPPGDPAAAIKLVNNLDLIVTNLSTTNIFYGNNFLASGNPPFSAVANTNTPRDSINNVENVYLSTAAGISFAVTVVGRSVNVNAVTAHTNNVVQDFALVISSGNGQVTNAMTVTDMGISSNPTGGQLITVITATNTPLFNQFVGANTPLLGTNTVSFAASTNLIYGSNAVVAVGMTNQWHFYVVKNNGEMISGSVSNAPNAGFVTFLPPTLSVARMGVYEDSDANATRLEADIDLYVSTDPTLTNLNPLVISNCVNGTQVGAGPVFNGASLGRGGTEFVVDINSTPGQVYYIGVKSEDQNASEYGFIPIFSATPFSQINSNGEEEINGVLLPVNIPDGSPAHPGQKQIFGLALQPIQIKNVIVSDTIVHQNIGDLLGVLNHNGISDVLNNHDSLGGPPGPYSFIYDDAPSPVTDSQPSDGPGSLQSYVGQQGIGPWILTEIDDSLTQTGAVTAFHVTIQPHRDLKQGITVSIAPHTFTNVEFIDVSAGFTNLTVDGIDETAPPPSAFVKIFVNEGSWPSVMQTNNMAFLDIPFGVGFLSNSVSIGPPLMPDRYYVGLTNTDSITHTILIKARLSFSQANISTVNWNSTGATAILDDAVVTNSIVVTNTDIIQSLNVGLRMDHLRISDLVFHLIGPDSTRYLLMENRGGTSTNGCGTTLSITTNIANFAANGTGQAQTNFISVTQSSGVLPISWDFFTITDQMTVYDGTNITPADVIFDTGVVSNTGSANIPFTTISGGLTIIMNQTNVPGSGDAWNYSIGSASNNFLYLAFTEDTNLTTTPIKFAPLPFVPTGASNLFYQPEQDISALNGQSAAGTWTLEIQDDRAGAGLTNLLLGWQLEFTFANTNFIPSTNTPTIVTNGIGPVTNVVPANGVSIFQVNVPTNADFATNILIFADAPLNLWWSTNLPATITNLNDFLLITNSTGGSSVLSTNSSPPLIPGGTYYLILQNTNSFDVTNAFEVGFHLLITFISPTNGVPITNSIGAGSLVWYEIDVPTNADWATNILLFADAPLNIWFSTNQPPTITNLNDVILIPNATNGISILGMNTAPTNIVMGGIYYLGVQNTNSFAVTNYAIEVDFHFITNNVASTNIVFSGIIYTNIGGTNGFLLIWFAPTNDIFQVQESDTLPPVWNTFTNIITYTGPPTPTNGMFTFFDDGSQYPFGPMRFYQLILLQATNTLTLPSQTNFTANVGIPLVVTNTATDSNPALTLSYFFTNFPATSTTASIDTNGIISWTPGAADASSAFKFTTVVTDSGLPPLSATNSFTVFVLPYPAISNVVVTVTNVTLQWTAPTNDLFLVEWTTNLSPAVWTPFPPPPITSTTGIFTFIDTNAPTAMKFYRLDWLPLP